MGGRPPAEGQNPVAKTYDEPPDGIIITARRMISSGSHSVAPAASRSSYMGTKTLQSAVLVPAYFSEVGLFLYSRGY